MISPEWINRVTRKPFAVVRYLWRKFVSWIKQTEKWASYVMLKDNLCNNKQIDERSILLKIMELKIRATFKYAWHWSLVHKTSFKVFGKLQIVSLNWFAAQHETSTSECQNNDLFCLDYNAKLNENILIIWKP